MHVIFLWLMTAILTGSPAQQPPANQRFDYLVRADFFAGAAGDEARLARAMELCERTLADNPRHPEAMVWHGAGLLVRAGQAFQKGDIANGGPLFERGIAQMNEAVTLAPDSPGVLIPRAATLFEATRGMPPEMARPLLQSAVANYEHVLEIQQATWAKLGDHPKGELLFGLADGSARLGDQQKARMYFERLVTDAPSSGQAPRAKSWMETGTVPKANGLGCVGCHK
jgi:tetratricopeptide (TPR) repeat protein